MNPIIEVKNLKYKYPHTDKLVLDDISFTIEKGEFIGIVGANGAGKSTLTQALVGLVPQFYKGAYGGQVLVKRSVWYFRTPLTSYPGQKTPYMRRLPLGCRTLVLSGMKW